MLAGPAAVMKAVIVAAAAHQRQLQASSNSSSHTLGATDRLAAMAAATAAQAWAAASSTSAIRQLLLLVVVLLLLEWVAAAAASTQAASGDRAKLLWASHPAAAAASTSASLPPNGILARSPREVMWDRQFSRVQIPGLIGVSQLERGRQPSAAKAANPAKAAKAATWQSRKRTEAIQATMDPQQLLYYLQQHGADLDHINVSTAFTWAVKLWRTPQQQREVRQQLLSELHQLANRLQHRCRARELANIIWSAAGLRAADTAALLLPVFLQPSSLQQAIPQEVASVLWAAANLQLPLPEEQVQQLLQRMVELLPHTKPQEVANVLRAAANMEQQVPQQQLQQLLQRFVEELPDANPQEVSNTLWAVATMGQQVPQQQLSGMLQRLVQLLPDAKPQEVSNTLVACARMQHAPLQLLSALQHHQPQQLHSVLAGAKPKHLGYVAWACGHLGYSSKLLPGLLLQQAVQLLQAQQGADSFTMQNLCKLCWAAAVLDLQRCVPHVLQLAGACKGLWQTAAVEELQQLQQVQLWLLDSQLPAPGQGLSGVLTQQQLGQCKVAWEQQRKANAAKQASGLQQAVFAAAKQLPAGTWQQQPAMEQPTPDGAYSIDIAGVTADGVRVAVEVDGPWHFVQPGNTLDGPTQCRNRALAAHGYTVVSIPYWEWRELRGREQQQTYLLAKLQSAAGAVGAGVDVAAATAKAARSGSRVKQRAPPAAAKAGHSGSSVKQASAPPAPPAAAEVPAAAAATAEGLTRGQRAPPRLTRKRRLPS